MMGTSEGEEELSSFGSANSMQRNQSSELFFIMCTLLGTMGKVITVTIYIPYIGAKNMQSVLVQDRIG